MIKKIAQRWVIRHKPTGKIIPEPKGKMGRGGSHVEPEDPILVMPRLFMTEIGAKRALSAWLQGKHTADMDYEYNDFTGGGFYYQAGVAVSPQPHRIKEDMEVVPVSLLMEFQ